tara:strand:+ start:1459 stop:1677 length:219 start_codon:yes stop_codon:yes gene_type:complete
LSFSSVLIDQKRKVFYLYFININGLDLEKTNFFNGFNGFQMFNLNEKNNVFLTNQNYKNRGHISFLAVWDYK